MAVLLAKTALIVPRALCTTDTKMYLKLEIMAHGSKIALSKVGDLYTLIC